MRLMVVIYLPPQEKFTVSVSLKDILKSNSSYWN